MVNVGHYHGLEEIAKDGVAKNGPAGFDFQAATPLRVICIDFIP